MSHVSRIPHITCCSISDLWQFTLYIERSSHVLNYSHSTFKLTSLVSHSYDQTWISEAKNICRGQKCPAWVVGDALFLICKRRICTRNTNFTLLIRSKLWTGSETYMGNETQLHWCWSLLWLSRIDSLALLLYIVYFYCNSRCRIYSFRHWASERVGLTVGFIWNAIESGMIDNLVSVIYRRSRQSYCISEFKRRSSKWTN